jgi:hypothetical protein
MPVSDHRQRVADYERVRRHENNQASRLRFVQEDGRARLAVAIGVQDGGVLERLFLGTQAKFFFGVENPEFEPAGHSTLLPLAHGGARSELKRHNNRIVTLGEACLAAGRIGKEKPASTRRLVWFRQKSAKLFVDLLVQGTPAAAGPPPGARHCACFAPSRSMAKWFVAVRELRVPEPIAAPAQVEHSFLNEYSAKEFVCRLPKKRDLIAIASAADSLF